FRPPYFFLGVCGGGRGTRTPIWCSATGWGGRRSCGPRLRRVYWMSQWPAASKPSNTLRECSVNCVEPALENIGWNGGLAIGLNGAPVPIPQHSTCTPSPNKTIQYFRESGVHRSGWHYVSQTKSGSRMTARVLEEQSFV